MKNSYKEKLKRVLPSSAIDLIATDSKLILLELDRFSAYVASAGQNKTLLLKQASYIKNNSGIKAEHSASLIIEIGGTNTRACLYVGDSSNNQEWFEIFKLSNNKMLEEQEIPADDHSMKYFIKLIFHKICKNYASLSKIKNLAVIWSNALNIKVLSSSQVRGLQGIVFDRKIAYQKTEPFIRDLQDGDDLSAMFLMIADEFEMNLNSFVIGNDTVFIAAAVPGSLAGGVVSTGTNLCIYDPTYGFCNTEAGARIELSPESQFFTQFEYDYFQKNLSLEDLTAGKMFMELFKANIFISSQQGCLSEVAKKTLTTLVINSGTINKIAAIDLNKLQSNQNHLDLDLSFLKDINSEDSYTIVKIAQFMEARAGSLAGLMFTAGALGCDTSEYQKPFLIAVDSSQRNFSISGIFQKNAEAVANLKNVEIVWLKAEGSNHAITPAIRGALNSLASFHYSNPKK